MRMHLHEVPVPPKTLRGEIPDWLNNLILKMLEKDPRGRPAAA